MTIVVTGAAGFIGANLVKALNRRGETDIVAVDNLTRADKFANLVDCEIGEYVDKEEFLVRIGNGDFDDDIAAIFHQGACSDTLATDGRYVVRNNYRYSVTLLDSRLLDVQWSALVVIPISQQSAVVLLRQGRTHP